MALFPESATSGPSSSPRRNRCGASSRNTWTVERPLNLRTTSSDIELLGPGLDCLTNQWHPHVGGHFFQNDPYVGRLAGNKVRMLKSPGSARASHEPIQRATARLLTSTLAIIRSKLFSAAKDMQTGTQLFPRGPQRRLRRVLSALLRCGSCGSGMAMDGRHESGHIRCSAAVSAACPPDAPGSEAHPRQ